MMMSGRVLSVETVTAGADVLEAAPVGASSVVLVDAVALDPAGGQVVLPSGQVAAYTSVDLDADVVTFAEPLPVALVEADRLSVTPVASWTQAVVELSDGGELVPVRVPHTMQSSMPVGVRAEDREVVDVEQREDGRFWLHEVRDEPPHEVWGDPDGAAAEMRPSGLSFYTVGPSGRYEATRLGSGEDRLGVFNADGQVVGGVTADGSLVGQSGVVAGDFSVGGVPLLGRLWDNSPGAPQGWLERLAAGHVVTVPFETQAPSRPGGERWGYAKVGFTARAGRSYTIRADQTIVTGGTYLNTDLHVTTDGTEPTITSPTLGDPQPSVPGGGGVGVQIQRSFTSPEDASVRVMVANVSFSGTHTVLRATFTVTDNGPQGQSGGGTYTTGREATPPPTVREYTSTWTATGFRVYDETTQPVPDATQPRQYGDPTGRRDYTAIAFDGTATHGAHTGETMTTATTGATITKAEVFLANTSWGGGDAGHISLGKGGVAALPPTLEPQATVQPSVPTGAGAWIEVPTTWFNDTNRVVTLGDVDGGVQGGWFMAPGDELPPQVRLTYTR